MKTEIYITTSFPAFHAWPKAPEQVAFLRNKHRHTFHVKMLFEVTHDDRQLEFFMVKEEVSNYIRDTYHSKDLGATSCEMIGEQLLEHFTLACRVEVSEDLENGVVVHASS